MRGQSIARQLPAMAMALALALATTLASCSSDKGPTLEAVSGETLRVSRLERVFTRVMEKARIPAISCAVVNGGEVVYARTFGVRNADDDMLAADADTVFAAASFSKTVFAYLVMLLVEDGVIQLDVPVETYLRMRLADDPHWSDLGGDLRTTRITARQALSHTIGFPNWRFLTDDGKLRIDFEPGARFSYSGEGIVLLQRVVEHLTGRGLDELANERVFAPLGMTRTSYVWRRDFEDNHAVPHDEFGRPRRLNRRRDADAAGSMFTTAGDYARFVTALLGAEGLRGETIEEMLALQVPIRTRGMFGPASREESGRYEPIRLGWSLGWGRFETEHGPAHFHTGHDFGWQNYTVTHSEPGIGVVLLSNSNNFESVARELVAAAIGADESPFDWLGYPRFDPEALRQAPPDPVIVEVEEEILQRYVGDYSFMGERTISFKVANGRLLASTDEEDEWSELAATSETDFFIPGDEPVFHFVPLPGRPARLVIRVEGLEIATTPTAEALQIPQLEAD